MADLPEAPARSRLSGVPVARLATVDQQGRPHLIPTTFAVDGDCIYTAIDSKPKASRNLKRLRNIRGNPYVAVLADHYEDNWEQLWWVRADGRATILEAATDTAGPIRLLTERYWQYREQPPKGPVIRIQVERWTGWTSSADQDSAA